MESECYAVEILYYLNPHLIWVKNINAGKKSADISFEQIGVYGILPIKGDVVLEEVKGTAETVVWAPAILPLMKHLLSEATNIWFSPTFIDRRSSIFDHNIHKYGEITLKTKDGLKKLSDMLKITCFAYYNEVQFHQDLSSCKFNTNLNKHEMHKVVKALENACEQSKYKKEDSFKNQTKEDENYKTVPFTAINLDKHNKSMQHSTKTNKIIEINENKYEEQSKDMNEISIYSGKSKPKKSYDIDQNNADSNDVFNLLDKAKEVLLKHVMKGEVATNYEKEEKNIEAQILYDTKEINNEVSETDRKMLDVSFKTNQYKVAKKAKKSPITKPTPEFNTETHMIVTMGPPEIDKVKLGPMVVPKTTTTSINCELMEEIDNNQEENHHKLKENPLAGLDSDVDFPISKPINTYRSDRGCLSRENLGSAVKPNDSKFVKSDFVSVIANKLNHSLKNISKDTSDLNNVSDNTAKILSGPMVTLKSTSANSSLSSVNGGKGPQGLPKYLLKKIRRFNPEFNNDVSSETDTSAKDNSSSSDVYVNDYDKTNQNNKNVDSDNETTITKIVERLDLESKSVIKPEFKLTVNNVDTKKNHVNPFKNFVDASISKFIDKLISHVLMVHSKSDSRIIPSYQLRDIPFNANIFSALSNMKVQAPMMLQTVTWPTILRGNSVFMISPMHSGKTLGYVPAVCRLVADFDVADFPESNGPICIIVCATSVSTTTVEKLCRKFLGHTKKVLSCFAGANETELTTTLLNGCDVLVCTPPSLLRLLQLGNFSVDLKRLNTFVLDDCERIGNVYLNEIKYFTIKIKEMLKKRANKDLKVQYIVASRSWCDFMESLAKKAPDSVVCIGSFQECVLYSKAGLSVGFAKKENKLATVLEFLENVDKSKKTVIVCRDDNEVSDIKVMFGKVRHHVFSANSEMKLEDLHTLSTNWAEYDEPVIGAILVCCDDVIQHLNVTDAHNLLQFSLPSLFSMFARRYSVLTDHYPSIFKTKNDDVKIKIILDADNVEQLPKIVHFLKRCTPDLPNSLDEACDTILREKDFIKAKRFVPICDSILSLGECPDYWNCMQRHSIFKEIDTPSDQVPTTGIVTFKILHFHSAVAYSARLLTYIVNGKTTKFPQNYSSLSLKLGLHYSHESKRIPHGIAKVGDVCAVAIKENFYRRCQVIKVLSKYEKNGNPKEILIKLIDEEKWERTRDIYLYYLPEHLKNVHSYVSLVTLANLQPKDKDVTFSVLALQHLKDLTETDDDLYMRARISMTIGNCIIVDELEACQDLSSSKQTVVRYNLKTELLKVHALSNPEHLPKLEKLCREGGLQIKADVIVEKEEKEIDIKLPEPHWAHLDEDMQLVYFASAVDPYKFFLRLEKFEDCLDILTKEIQEYIAADTTVAVEKVNEGDIVLAKFPDDSLYYRARIDTLVTENKCKCFFVDHGDWRVVGNKDVVPITAKYINKMPFQAIECRLVGVKPFGNQWTEYSTNYFCDQCFVGTSNDLKKLYVKYFTKEISESTSGHKYGVVLIDTTTDIDVIINDTLIQHQMAQIDENEIQYLENLDFMRRETEIPSEDDEWVNDDAECKTVDLYKMQETNQTSNSLLFAPKPIRSVPLVASDDENDDFDLEFDSEELKSVFKITPDNTSTNEMAAVPALMDNESDTQNNEGYSTCSSKISDFEIIPSQKVSIQELDSDDLSTPEESAVIVSSEASPNKVMTNELKELEIKRKPKLCWRQTETTVSIRIELIGVEDYELNIADKQIKFACEVLDTEYGFDFELYGVVDPKKSSHQPKGLYIYVKLTKLLPRSWMSLQLDDKIPRKWIVYDPDSIQMSSDDEDDLALKKEDMKKLIENAHYNESEDESDDDTFGDDLMLFDKKIGYESN